MVGEVGFHRKGEISIELILQNIRRNPSLKNAGAIACFIGIARSFSLEGKEVKGLSYEAYEERVVEVMQKIRSEMLRRDGVVDVHVHHVVDVLDIGDETLLVAVAGKHRREVFSTLEDTVNRVKSGVPIYKKEFFTDGSSRWVSEAELKSR